VPAFRLVRFPDPPSELDVRVSTHPALHESTVDYSTSPMFALGHSVGMFAPR
jgi:hypothetical protein